MTTENEETMPAEGVTYGYARVSTSGQNLDRQTEALRAFGVEESRVYCDKASGKDFDRPAWRELLGVLRAGDLLVVESIDRLGRSYEDITAQWRHIVRSIGADIVVLDMPLLDTRDPAAGRGVTGVFVSDIVLQLLSYVAQVERENIRQRQAEGVACAKARGVRFGRPRKEKPADWPRVRDDCLARRVTRKQAAAALHVSPATLGRWLAEDRG